ncbi:helix-turn-helix domain-containing protein [Nitrobacter sp. TKz-YC02]|uniref:AlbA family DNA-binding domain-containing protein n=1 Tax=Nitrobacter sp. TKz-YC02 TaxID=3398704 RepID=UPI003CED9C45
MLKLETIEDVQSLIDDGIEEGLELEYKGSPALSRDSANVNELCKDVSAMANSAGGQIIYGVEEDKTARKPKGLDQGVSDPKITREWIQQTLNSRVHPRMDGISITRIVLPSGAAIYVVEVPATQAGPHQAPDDKYYKRFDGLCTPMKDYEIKDVMRRGEQPVLAVDLWNLSAYASKGPFGEDSVVIPIKAALLNRNSTPAIYTALRIFFDRRFEIIDQGPMYPNGAISLGQEDVVTVFRNFAPPDDFPIFRETPPDPIEIKIATSLQKDATYFVAAHVATPGYSRLYKGSISVVRDMVTVDWPD